MLDISHWQDGANGMLAGRGVEIDEMGIAEDISVVGDVACALPIFRRDRQVASSGENGLVARSVK